MALLKFAMLITVVCCAGCQTTRPTADTAGMPAGSPRSEKLFLRIEEYVSNYDVEVQRAVLNPAATSREDQWKVVSAPRVSGYPEKWRTTEEADDSDAVSAKTSYLLAGEMVSITLAPGSHLVAKVMPDKQNTARVIGIFSESKETPLGLEVLTVPFDAYCTIGEFVLIYNEEVDLEPML